MLEAFNHKKIQISQKMLEWVSTVVVPKNFPAIVTVAKML